MKRRMKLNLSRETLRQLAAPELRGAAGGLTTPLTHCAGSICVGTCLKCISVQIVCTA
jgi:hypothetical protein